MATYIFKSTDGGAPTLSGTAGDLTTLLDALLVNGYNTKTITIARSGTTATATCTSHGFVDKQRVVISGADQTDYNIEARITYLTANTFSYQVANSPATPATGTISAKVAPLGWTTAFTATNKRAYQQKAGTNQFYLRVTDDGTGSAAYGRIVGYESMSDIDTGTNAFPTAAQVSGGLYAHKSSTANATTRPWRAYSDGKIVHIYGRADGTWGGLCLTFGDFYSRASADAYNTIIRASASASWGGAGLSSDANDGITSSVAASGVYIARSYTGTGTSIGGGLSSPFGTGATNSGSIITLPSPITGEMVMREFGVIENTANSGPRGFIPGWWVTPHNLVSAWLDLDTVSGAVGSPLEGKEFEFCDTNYDGGGSLFEISDTWRSA